MIGVARICCLCKAFDEFYSFITNGSNFFLADVATNLPMIAQATRMLEVDHVHIDKYLTIRLVVCPIANVR